MSRLRQYEISFWRDEIVEGQLTEHKMYVFGSDELDTQARALEPKLKKNVNGSNELTFKMNYQYIDNITGEKIFNPYVRDLINEAKIKLKFKNKWYDFVIKNINKNTSNKTISYTATDLHINELSKNGFGLTLSTELENSIGTVEEIGNLIFADTDWSVDASEKIPQTLEESLIEVVLSQQTVVNAIKLVDDETVAPQESSSVLTIPENSTIYLFYSCCKNQSDRLQFIYIPQTEKTTKNQDRIIINKNCQYYIDGMTYFSHPSSQKYGLFVPEIFNIVSFFVSTSYRGSRYVFSEKTLYNNVLQRYVTEYIDNNGQIVHEFTDTEYIAPNIIQNFITNNTFKSTTGWTGSYAIITKTDPENYINKQSTLGTKCSVGTTPNLLDELVGGQFDQNKKYKPFLSAQYVPSEATEGLLVNSSFYDQRKHFKKFSKGEKYVLLYRLTNSNHLSSMPFTAKVGERIYNTSLGCYATDYNCVFITFNSNESIEYVGTINEEGGYRYIIAEVENDYSFSEEDFARIKIQTFISPSGSTSQNSISFNDFQIFPYYEKDNGAGFILPIDSVAEAKAVKKYSYFNPNNEINKQATQQSEMLISTLEEQLSDLQVVYNIGAEKVNTVEISKSNYFNACQKMCEIFECWADFDIEHDDQGYILSKTVRFKNYIGKDNYAGFRYGVNLKDISRKDDSKNIVSKLIVTDNTNKHANNGFCTIARAGSNETGENYIYNFSYYINQGLLDYNGLMALLYDTDAGCGPDLGLIAPNHVGINEPLNCQGYYTRLSALNKEIDNVANAIIQFSKPLMQAQADVTTNEAGREASEKELITNIDSFRQVAGFEYTEIYLNDIPGLDPEEIQKETERRVQMVQSNITIRNYLNKIVELLPAKEDYEEKLANAQAQLEEYEETSRQLEETRQMYLQWKKELNNLFFKTYYRFISEGTWTDGDQIDDEKYFIDAQSVAYTSSMPQVTYTFNVVSVENLPGYENYSFEIADKTFIEDEEYFGYDENGNPYREEVVISEITYSLEETDKDTIQIKNYKNQFQDLFQTITASVQTVNYTSGAWNNAANFTESTDQEKSSFLRGALNHVDTILTNAGEQSIIWDNTGITISDNSKPNQQIKLIAGGIFLRDKDGDGLGWKAGITADGINAKLITTGQLNTGVIQIMRGDEPYFRWDDHGITAYSFDENDQNLITNYDTRKGVRFDRFGVYGYDMYDEEFISTEEIKDGQTWHPNNTDEIRNNSIFSLTWDGLQLKPGAGYYGEDGKTKHTSFAKFGKTDGKLYTGWENWYTPSDTINNDEQDKPFVKILTAGRKNGDTYEEKFALYDNGVIVAQDGRLRGTIYAEAGYIGSEETGWMINQNSLTNGEIGQSGSFHMYASIEATESDEGGVSIAGSEQKKDWLLTIGGNFGVDVDGKLFATGVNIGEGGTIGGWVIGRNTLSSEYGSNKIYLNSNPAEGNGNWIEATGGDNSFSVNADAVLHAKGAIIETGQIGSAEEGWTITKDAIYGVTNSQYSAADPDIRYGLVLRRWVDIKNNTAQTGPVLAIGVPRFDIEKHIDDKNQLQKACFCVNHNGEGKWGSFEFTQYSCVARDNLSQLLFRPEGSPLYTSISKEGLLVNNVKSKTIELKSGSSVTVDTLEKVMITDAGMVYDYSYDYNNYTRAGEGAVQFFDLNNQSATPGTGISFVISYGDEATGQTGKRKPIPRKGDLFYLNDIEMFTGGKISALTFMTEENLYIQANKGKQLFTSAAQIIVNNSPEKTDATLNLISANEAYLRSNNLTQIQSNTKAEIKSQDIVMTLNGGSWQIGNGSTYVTFTLDDFQKLKNLIKT